MRSSDGETKSKTETLHGYVLSIEPDGLLVSLWRPVTKGWPYLDAFMDWDQVPKIMRPQLTKNILFIWEFCEETGQTVELTLPLPPTEEQISEADRGGQQLWEELKELID